MFSGGESSPLQPQSQPKRKALKQAYVPVTERQQKAEQLVAMHEYRTQRQEVVNVSRKAVQVTERLTQKRMDEPGADRSEMATSQFTERKMGDKVSKGRASRNLSLQSSEPDRSMMNRTPRNVSSSRRMVSE